MVTLCEMDRGKGAVLSAFDRLFDRALDKLDFECSGEDKEKARQRFVERYDEALQVFDELGDFEVGEAAIEDMEAAIDGLSPAELAGYLAAVPLSMKMQESMRAIALRAAETRLLEHLVSQADDSYGGN